MTVACGDADWYMVGVNLAEGELGGIFFFPPQTRQLHMLAPRADVRDRFDELISLHQELSRLHSLFQLVARTQNVSY